MSKIFLFFPLFLFSISPTYWWINDTIYLKKDYPVIYKLKYNNKTYTLKFRWTLYKNDGIVMLYNFKNHPYQNILYKNMQLNGFKKYISFNDTPNTPYFMIYFRDFKDNIAKFQFLVYNPKQNIESNISNPKYRDRKWVLKLPPMDQKKFEREIK